MTVVRIAQSLPQPTPAPEEGRGPDPWVLAATLGLVALGVAMVFSASVPSATAGRSGDIFRALRREAVVVGMGLAAMLAASRMSLQWLRSRAGMLLALTIGLLVAVIFLGREVNGARSWFAIPGTGLSFQPSEMAKIVLVIAAARYFARLPRGLSNWRRALPPFMMLLVVTLLVAAEPDMGTAAVIVAAMLVYYHIAGARLRHILAAGSLGLVGAAAMVWHHPYQLRRILDFFAGSEVNLGGGYQRMRALIALGSGGVTGRGYLSGVEKYFYLPASSTDSILAVIGEELGMIATWAVIAAFLLLVWRGMTIAGRAPDRFSGLVAAGVTCVIGVQALLNIAVVTGSIPATGVPLPFVSYGGSSLFFALIGIGLLLNVSRTAAPARAGAARPQ